MNIMIIGNDGRAYSLAKRLDAEKNDILVVPGNPSINGIGFKCNRLSSYSLDHALVDTERIVDLANRVQPDLIIVTRVETSYEGVVDRLLEYGHTVFGVNRYGSNLEVSKEFGKAICEKYKIRVPEWKSFSSKERAKQYVRLAKKPFVIKADGLACGKGVVVCNTVDETLEMIARCEHEEIILEETLQGIEVAYTVLVADEKIIPMFTNFEHKKLGNADLGTMTAEMGTVIVKGVHKDVMKELFAPLKPFLKEVGYRGLLDINTIYVPELDEHYMLEFTTRFGDPTTEIMLGMIEDNVGELFYKVAKKKIKITDKVNFKHDFGTGVCIVSGGYPYKDACMQGLPIFMDNSKMNVRSLEEENLHVMSAIVTENNEIVTNGGRQFTCTGYGDNCLESIKNAYRMVKRIHFVDKFYRTDIGERYGWWLMKCKLEVEI